MKLRARSIATGLVVLLIGAIAAVGIHLHKDGWRFYIIHTGSMTGTYNSGGLVIDKPVTSPLHVGETITFLHSGLSSDVITHRIVGLKHGTIQTKGDANKVRDTWDIRPDQVKGHVVGYLPYMGYVVYFLHHRTGDAAVVTAIIALFLLWELFALPELATAGALESELRQLPVRGIERLRRGAARRPQQSGYSAADRLAGRVAQAR